MTPRRSFRFATQLNAVASHAELAERARAAESCGFSTITVADHFRPGDLAPLVAMMAMAAATTTVRVGSNVLANDYRHPMVVAKELATIDLLSDGRLEVGLGAGWLQSDYDSWGLPMAPPGMRVARLAESIRILKALWSGEVASIVGEHYTIHSPADVARTRQRPHPPLLVGAGGRRMLELAAREADIVSITFNQRHGAPDARLLLADAGNGNEGVHDQKIEWIRQAAGPRFAALELAVFAIVTVTADREAALASAAEGLGVSPRWLADAPQFYFGTVDEIVHDLLAKRERYGISYIMTPGDAFDAVTPIVERLSGR
jgi:probable F420-dependent oxidoreductase